MQGARLEAERPADTSRPGDPQAGTDPERTAERPREGGGPGELLRLQQQVARLHRQLRRQEARWSAALRHLQTQIDALKRQDRGPRGGQGAAELRGPGATPEAPLQLRTRPDAQPASTKIERVISGQIVTREDGDKTVSIRLHVRGAASAGSGPRAEGQPSPPGGGKAATPPGRSLPTLSGRTPAGRAALGAPPTEDGPAAQDTDTHLSPSEGPEGKSLTQAQTDGLAGPSADTEPQVGEAASASHQVAAGPKGPEEDAGAETTVLHFLNGDTQRILPGGRVVYYCADAQTTRTTHPSGLQVLRFPNRRTEKFYPDGSKETLFPDGTVKRLRDGQEETVFPDGTSVRVERNGDRTIVFSNGQRDVHTAQFKRREYPDGTVKTVYGSGLQETKFASGRVRVRHVPGSIVLDQKQAVRHSQEDPQ